jgi:thiamine-phosphate pyrophosphorylase
MKLPRVYPIVDAAVLESRGIPVVEAARALLDGGAEILQFRFKDQLTGSRFDEAAAMRELCRASCARFVVNDRADVAALIDAGLHLGQADLPPAAARRIVKGVVGFSTHSEAQLRAAAAEPVDYVALGPIFGTASKDKPDPAVGISELRRIAPLAGARPLVAIGGITRASAPAVWDAGAASVAVIGDLLPERDTIEDLRKRMDEWIKLAGASNSGSRWAS